MRPTLTQHLTGKMNAARRGVWKRAVPALLSACFGLTLVLSCTPVVTGTQAKTLSVFLKISDQYTSAPMVTMDTFISDGIHGVALIGKQRMECNGVVFVSVYPATERITLPRQPAGSAYDCRFTNEQGKQTALTIPIPPGSKQITSPAPGAAAPLASPLPPGSATPTAARPPALVSIVRVSYTLPTLPADAQAQVTGTATCGTNTSSCGVILGSVVASASPYVLTDADVVYGSGFEVFPSGATGMITMDLGFFWDLPNSRFYSVRVFYDDSVSVPVHWSRSQ